MVVAVNLDSHGSLSGPPGVTALIVDDHPLIRQALSLLLGAEAWIGEVIEAGTVAEATAVLSTNAIGLAIVDLGLPDGHGALVVEGLRQHQPGCAVLVLTMTEDVADIHRSLGAGAQGYLRKTAAPDAIVSAAHAVADGGFVLGPEAARLVREAGTPHGPGLGSLPAPFDRISPRDVRIVAELARGRTTQQISRDLNISAKTVQNRLTMILEATGTSDRIQLALLAHRAGLVTGSESR